MSRSAPATVSAVCGDSLREGGRHDMSNQSECRRFEILSCHVFQLHVHGAPSSIPTLATCCTRHWNPFMSCQSTRVCNLFDWFPNQFLYWQININYFIHPYRDCGPLSQVCVFVYMPCACTTACRQYRSFSSTVCQDTSELSFAVARVTALASFNQENMVSLVVVHAAHVISH